MARAPQAPATSAKMRRIYATSWRMSLSSVSVESVPRMLEMLADRMSRRTHG